MNSTIHLAPETGLISFSWPILPTLFLYKQWPILIVLNLVRLNKEISWRIQGGTQQLKEHFKDMDLRVLV